MYKPIPLSVENLHISSNSLVLALPPTSTVDKIKLRSAFKAASTALITFLYECGLFLNLSCSSSIKLSKDSWIFSTPIDFTADTTSGTLSFDTTETAVWVGAYDYPSVTTNRGVDSGAGRIYFDIGPFILRFTVN